MNVKVFMRVSLPVELQKAFLQHVRDFDIANPGCHLEVAFDGPEMPLADMVQLLAVNPELAFATIFERAKWEKPDEN